MKTSNHINKDSGGSVISQELNMGIIESAFEQNIDFIHLYLLWDVLQGILLRFLLFLLNSIGDADSVQPYSEWVVAFI